MAFYWALAVQQSQGSGWYALATELVPVLLVLKWIWVSCSRLQWCNILPLCWSADAVPNLAVVETVDSVKVASQSSKALGCLQKHAT